MTNMVIETLDAVVDDDLAHDIHLRVWGGVDPRGHNRLPDGEPFGDCYKCRIIRDTIRDALRRFDRPMP